MKTGATVPKCNMISANHANRSSVNSMVVQRLLIHYLYAAACLHACLHVFFLYLHVIWCHMHASTCAHPLIYAFRFLYLHLIFNAFQDKDISWRFNIFASTWLGPEAISTDLWSLARRLSPSSQLRGELLRSALMALGCALNSMHFFGRRKSMRILHNITILLIVLYVFNMWLIGYSLSSICLQQQPWIRWHLRTTQISPQIHMLFASQGGPNTDLNCLTLGIFPGLQVWWSPGFTYRKV